MKKSLKVISLLLSVVMLFGITASAYSADEMASSVTAWLEKNITVEEAAENNQIDSYLDWTVFATARYGCDSYVDDYKNYIGNAVSENFDSLYLSDYARISLAAMSAGLNPKNIGGKNLLEAIAQTDFSQEAYTGGLFYALIALNAADYAEDAQKELLDIILDSQRDDGGFNSSVKADPDSYWTVSGDPDSTGMALQALAVFSSDSKVQTAIDKAVKYAKANQLDDGGYGAWGVSAESTAQIMIGLCAVGIDPLGADFTKGKNNMLTSLSSFINDDGGARCWDGSSNIMTSYQLLMAVNAYDRFVENDEDIYTLSLLDNIKHEISTSVSAVPFLASVIISIIEFLFNLLNLELYVQP